MPQQSKREKPGYAHRQAIAVIRNVQDWIDLVMSMWRGVVVSLGGDVSGTFSCW